MIDGVKIDVPNLSGKEWLCNGILSFSTYVSMETGEADGTQTAKYHGLTFIVTASKKHHGLYYCSLRGSLHKYYNHGHTNANDFTFDQLNYVVNDLQQKFAIDPLQAIIRNLEIGVNLHATQPAKNILKNLVAINGDPFTDFCINRKKIGKGIGKQQYSIKIYDKGKQDGTSYNNLLRIEIAVKKMAYLKRYGIAKLADLTQMDKVRPLGALLIECWKNTIYFDKAVKWRAMSNFDQKKLLYYATSCNWSDFDRKQRLRAKQHFKKIISTYGLSSTHTDISNMIGLKWHDLEALKCPRFNHDFKENRSPEMSTFYPLEYTDKTYPYSHGGKIKKSTQKPIHQNLIIMRKEPHTSPKKAGAKCRTCFKPIRQKRSDAIYCSKRCNNSHHASLRKQERHELAERETMQMNILLPYLESNDFKILIDYKDENGNRYFEWLHQSEILAPPQWVRRVFMIEVFTLGTINLTSHRAKKVIGHINKLNKSRCAR